MIIEVKFQIGKNGLTEGVIQSLNLALKEHSRVRISVLKSSGRDKVTIKQMAESIRSKVVYDCDYRIIGFTIILIRVKAKPLKSRILKHKQL
jgi:RNA-binding protein YhbY